MAVRRCAAARNWYDVTVHADHATLVDSEKPNATALYNQTSQREHRDRNAEEAPASLGVRTGHSDHVRLRTLVTICFLCAIAYIRRAVRPVPLMTRCHGNENAAASGLTTTGAAEDGVTSRRVAATCTSHVIISATGAAGTARAPTSALVAGMLKESSSRGHQATAVCVVRRGHVVAST